MIINKGESPAQGVCVALGAILALFLLAQVMIVNIMAVSMFLTVYHNWALSYGKYDWVLFVLTFGVPAGYTIVGLSVGAFGPDLYWCYLNPFNQAGWIMWIITFLASICCISVPAFCYYMIYRKINETSKSLHAVAKAHGSQHTSEGPSSTLASSSQNVSGHAESETSQKGKKDDSTAKKNRKIVRKLLQYELVLILTFSSLIVYGGSIAARQEPLPLVFLVVICFNSAGWFNAVVFFYQESKKKKSTAGGPTGGAVGGGSKSYL
ncbi:hypothetical protein HDU97_010210 [Phlyctochytrium planicorne]|nr:hypothetical protein HDU97_010210 [Phlyctochytrium planicorne]